VSGERRIAVDLDRTHEQKALDAGARSRFRDAPRGNDVGLVIGKLRVAKRFVHDMRASGQMDDGAGARQRMRERIVRGRGEIADHVLLRRRCLQEFQRADDPAETPFRGAQSRRQRRTDESHRRR
jgi:hypothetical protein